MIISRILAATLLLAGLASAEIRFRNSQDQSAEALRSGDARRLAETILLYQRDIGGWPKNYDRDANLSDKDKQKLRTEKNKRDTTFDNGTTHRELQFLARMHRATGEDLYKEAFIRGLSFTLEAQYENGGWPQFYPGAKGYKKYVTFNDGAMVGILTLLREIVKDTEAYALVDKTTRQRCSTALQKGIQCILECQLEVDGKKLAWCAQHDEKTFEPRKARSYELPSVSGGESSGIVRFLMGVEEPTPEIVASIKAAVAWFEASQLEGIRLVTKKDPALPNGRDKVIVKDPTASPLWARFYEIGTNKPIYCSRDGIPKDTLAEISYERRNGYSWLGNYGATLLEKDYPRWMKRLSAKSN
mgnify:CR=1 FL=1